MPAHLTQKMHAVRPRYNWKRDIGTFLLCVLLGSPFAVAGGYLVAEYQRLSPAPAVSNAVVPRTTTKLDIPDIIVTVRPTEVRVEKETIVIPAPQVPEQQRTRSRHAKPEPEETVTPVPPRHQQVEQTTQPQPTTTRTTTRPRRTVTTTTPNYDTTRREFVEQEPSMDNELPE